MKILQAGPDYEENLSIRYLSSSLLAAGHDATLAAFNSPADIPSVAEAAQRADIVGLSMCFQSRAQEFLHLAQLLKSRNPYNLSWPADTTRPVPPNRSGPSSGNRHRRHPRRRKNAGRDRQRNPATEREIA